jgi:ABC-type Mn2+/Zn2+ transport system permease subunit
MLTTNFWLVLVAGSLVAAAGGLLGSFALLRRMALVGDALSHVALPGIALGLIFNFNPFFGSLVFLILGTLLIWLIEHKTKLPVDTLVGVFFALALAIGALLVPETEILEALFGDISKINFIDFWVVAIASAAIIGLILFLSRRLMLTMISRDLALSAGLKPHALEFLFLMIFALTVAIGVKFVGALLMGSLVVIPAATARNLAGSMKSYMSLSVFLGVIGAVIGILISYFYNFSPGPSFILFSGLLFFLSIFFKRK